MIEVGNIFEGRVGRIESYGAFICSDEAEVFVHSNEWSWTESYSPREPSLLNRVVRVLITGWHPEKKQWFGSVRRAEPPESNPYLALTRVAGDERLPATVDFMIAGDCMVRLDNGAVGHVRRSTVPMLSIGDRVDVTVADVDPVLGRLYVNAEELIQPNA